MMSKHGPVAACRQVIMASKITDGFIRLLELKRSELTAEATVLRGPRQALFSEAVLARARGRLVAYGREDSQLTARQHDGLGHGLRDDPVHC